MLADGVLTLSIGIAHPFISCKGVVTQSKVRGSVSRYCLLCSAEILRQVDAMHVINHQSLCSQLVLLIFRLGWHGLMVVRRVLHVAAHSVPCAAMLRLGSFLD